MNYMGIVISRRLPPLPAAEKKLAAPVVEQKPSIWTSLKASIQQLNELQGKCLNNPKSRLTLEEAGRIFKLLTKLRSISNRLQERFFSKVRSTENQRTEEESFTDEEREKNIRHINRLLETFHDLAFSMMNGSEFTALQLNDSKIKAVHIQEHIDPEYIKLPKTSVDAGKKKKKTKEVKTEIKDPTWAFRRKLVDLQRNLLRTIKDILVQANDLRILNPAIRSKFNFMTSKIKQPNIARRTPELLASMPKLHLSVALPSRRQALPSMLLFKTFLERLVVSGKILSLAIKKSFNSRTKTIDINSFVRSINGFTIISGPKKTKFIKGYGSKLPGLNTVRASNIIEDLNIFIDEAKPRSEQKQWIDNFIETVKQLNIRERKTSAKAKEKIGTSLTLEKIQTLATDFRLAVGNLLRSLISEQDRKEKSEMVEALIAESKKMFDYDDFLATSEWSVIIDDPKLGKAHADYLESLDQPTTRGSNRTYAVDRRDLPPGSQDFFFEGALNE